MTLSITHESGNNRITIRNPYGKISKAKGEIRTYNRNGETGFRQMDYPGPKWISYPDAASVRKMREAIKSES